MITKILFYLAFALDLALTAALGWSVAETHLVSTQLVLIAAAVLALVPVLLLLLQREKKGENEKRAFRIAAIVLLLLMGLAEGAMCLYVQKYNSRMDEVTEVRTQYTQVEIYVREDDRAQTIEYAVESQYRFGTIANTDSEAIAQARTEIEEQYGRQLRVQSYGTLLDLIRALDEGRVDALLISSAYVELIDSLPDYESYAQTLRTLHTSSVKTDIQPLPTRSTGDGAAQDPDLWENSFCAYLSGIDSYGPVTVRSRSDVNILAVVNTETKTILLISTPRDFYVPFNFEPVGGALDKLTHAGTFGIEYSIQALGDLYELPITYYLRVNFSGFTDVIDTLGGVDVESDADFGSNGYYYQKGLNHLDGHAALNFVRDRKSFLEGDRARGRHQMAVIKGVINGLMSSKLLTNYSALMDQLADCFQTNASKALIGQLVQLTLDRSGGDWLVLTYSVDGWGNLDYAYSLGAYAYVMVPYPETVEYARSLAVAVASGETPSQEELQENAPVPPKQEYMWNAPKP